MSKFRNIVYIICAMFGLIITLSASFTIAQHEDAQPPILQRETGIGLYDVAWSPDGQLLAVAGDNGIIILDDQLQDVTLITGHTGSVLSVSWSPDGTRLASSGGVDDHAVKIWDYDAITDEFSLVITLETTSDVVPQVRWSPDGTMVASLLILGTSITGQPVLVGEVAVWDAITWDSVFVRGYITDPVRTLAWDPSSSTLITGGIYGIFTFDLDLMDVGWYQGLPTVPSGMAWSSFSNLVAYTYSGITILDGETGQVVIENVPNGGIIKAWSPVDDTILVAFPGTDYGIVDVYTGAVLRTFVQVAGVWALDWSDDGNWIVTGSENGVIAIWDASNLPSVEGIPTITPNPTNTPIPTPTATPFGGD